MIILSHRGEESAESPEELEHILLHRDSRGGGEFWISEVAGAFPCLLVGFSAEVAHVIWFPSEEHPGFRCLCLLDCPTLEGTFTLFVWDGCDPGTGELIPNEFVLDRSIASRVARQFFSSTVLPQGYEWFEL